MIELESCNYHDDCVVVYDGLKSCPVCKLEEAYSKLEKQYDKIETTLSDMNAQQKQIGR